MQNGQITKFSTKTKNKALAKEIYHDFLRTLIANRKVRVRRRKNTIDTIVSHTSRKKEVKEHEVKQDITPAQNEPVKNDLVTAYENYIMTCGAKGHTEQNINHKNWALKKLTENGITSFSDLNQENLDKMFLSNKQYAGATLETFVKEIKAFINNCIKRGIYDKELYGRLDWPRYKRSVRETTITEEHFKLMTEYLEAKGNYDFSFYLKTLYYTITRPEEARMIKIEDFDFSTNSARIFMNKTKEYKTVYLPEIFIKELSAYIKLSGKQSGYLFKGGEGKKYYYPKQFGEMRAALNLPEKYCLYAFRHTAITDQLNATNDIHFVAKQAGNNPEIAMKHYVNRNAKHYQDLVKKAFDKN
jgi:integrase